MKRLALVNVGTGSSFLAPIGLLFLSAWVKRTLPDWHPLVVDANWEEPHFRLLNPDQHWDAIGIIATFAALYATLWAIGTLIQWITKP